MTDEEALFAAIRADPENDTPRLAYADWLDANVGERRPSPLRKSSRTTKIQPASGSERAEYIRVDCSLVQLQEAAQLWDVKARIRELTARERQLRPAVVKAWEAPFRNGKPFRGRCGGFTFDRGIPQGVKLSGGEAENYGEAILRRAPIHTFQLHSMSPLGLARILRCRWLRNLAAMWIRLDDQANPQHRVDLSQFAEARHAQHLTTLTMKKGWTLSPDGADQLAHCTSLPALRRLELWSPSTGAAGFARLFDGPAFRQLTDLWIVGLPFRPGELAALLASPALAALNQLVIWESLLDGVAGEALAQSAAWRNLWRLDLSRGFGSDDKSGPVGGAWAALEAASPGKLEWLALPRDRLGDPEAASLTRWPIWHSLHYLELGGNPRITPTGWAQIIDALAAGSIRYLRLGSCSITDEVAAQLACAPQLASLETLILWRTPITDAGAIALAESRYLGAVEYLSVSDCPIGRVGRRKLEDRFGNAVHF